MTKTYLTIQRLADFTFYSVCLLGGIAAVVPLMYVSTAYAAAALITLTWVQ